MKKKFLSQIKIHFVDFKERKQQNKNIPIFTIEQGKTTATTKWRKYKTNCKKNKKIN